MRESLRCEELNNIGMAGRFGLCCPILISRDKLLSMSNVVCYEFSGNIQS
jgi:hypothetical protein